MWKPGRARHAVIALVRDWLPALLVCLGGCALAVDLALAKWIEAHQVSGEFKEIFTVVETFGHGLGVALILCAIWTLAPERRNAIPRLATASIGAGLAANVVKLMISRQRPRALDFSLEPSMSVWDTFGSFFPALQAGPAGQGFPSSHSATAVGFALALAIIFPRGRYLFTVLAVLACASRVLVGAHFLSDVLVGAAIGLVISRIAVQSLGSSSKRPEQARVLPISEDDAARFEQSWKKAI